MTPAAWGIPVADSINRELEQELVPEWRAKYLDYKVSKLDFTMSYRTNKAYIDWQEEGEGHCSRPTEDTPQSARAIFSTARSYPPWRVAVAIDAILLGSTNSQRRSGWTSDTRTIRCPRDTHVTLQSKAPRRATAAAEPDIAICGYHGKLWQYHCDTTVAWTGVRCGVLRASRPCNRPG